MDTPGGFGRWGSVTELVVEYEDDGQIVGYSYRLEPAEPGEMETIADTRVVNHRYLDAYLYHDDEVIPRPRPRIDVEPEVANDGEDEAVVDISINYPIDATTTATLSINGDTYAVKIPKDGSTIEYVTTTLDAGSKIEVQVLGEWPVRNSDPRTIEVVEL